MSLKVFLELVEIKAKTASVLPFLLGVCFSYYYYHSLNWANLLLFFIAMFLFNMSVDAWDNYNDYHNALDKEEYKQKTSLPAGAPCFPPAPVPLQKRVSFRMT